MKAIFLLACVAASAQALAAPVTYIIDPAHTYPSFEADHGGVSIWRGKFNKTAGSVVLDKAAGSGRVDITVDMDSVDFGLDIMNAEAKKPTLFDTAKYPVATYRGRLDGFVDGTPTQLVGELTLHGVTRPVALKINSFKCIPHPMLQRELCGADVVGSFNRDEFGIAAGKEHGFRMDVTLRIQVEGIASE